MSAQREREKPMKKFTYHSYLLRISFSLFLLLLFIILPFSQIRTSSPSHFRLSRQQLLQHHPSSARRVLLAMEEKVRLGSTPPSCYNKCNGCHPCLAVQVPTLPISPSLQADPVDFVDPSHGPSRYSNYKPLGWKCSCNNRFFNP